MNTATGIASGATGTSSSSTGTTSDGGLTSLLSGVPLVGGLVNTATGALSSVPLVGGVLSTATGSTTAAGGSPGLYQFYSNSPSLSLHM